MYALLIRHDVRVIAQQELESLRRACTHDKSMARAFQMFVPSSSGADFQRPSSTFIKLVRRSKTVRSSLRAHHFTDDSWGAMSSSLSCNLIASMRSTTVFPRLGPPSEWGYRVLRNTRKAGRPSGTAWCSSFISFTLSVRVTSPYCLLHSHAFESLDCIDTCGSATSCCGLHLWTSIALVDVPVTFFVILI